jgi:cell division protein FtsB
MADAPGSKPRSRPGRTSRPKPRAKAKAKAVKPKAETRKAAKAPKTRGERRRPSMRLALFLVVLVGLLFAFVYPTRTFLDQRDETNKARAQLEVLQSENARLSRESNRLSTDSEIERLAREKYGLVKPGERPFVILPAPTTPTTVPAPAPSTAAVAP